MIVNGIASNVSNVQVGATGIVANVINVRVWIDPREGEQGFPLNHVPITSRYVRRHLAVSRMWRKKFDVEFMREDGRHYRPEIPRSFYFLLI